MTLRPISVSAAPSDFHPVKAIRVLTSVSQSLTDRPLDPNGVLTLMLAEVNFYPVRYMSAFTAGEMGALPLAEAT